MNKLIVFNAILRKYKVTLNLNGTITVRLPGGKIKKPGKYKSGLPMYAFDYGGKKYYYQVEHIKQYIENGKIEAQKADPAFMYCEVCDYEYPKKEMRTHNICSLCWGINYHNCRRWEKSSYTTTKKKQSVIS